ncbi:class I SAM-dependent methyltransferase [Oceanibium sediminis]|uniref:class I SAM-dependent methyltransferase n=1 Tax=Oceanibium sediminis TaxID=2026339 RepID=UPI000DD2EB51|nr:SAM-dependent methyltransferase [Oceanibium sediminis]
MSETGTPDVLLQRLRARIASEGPLPVATYVQACLSDPEAGYYTTRTPLGREGDFITAPEISQMFGEMIGLWVAQVWLDAGRPDPFALVELGPGRGTLMADALRAARIVPGLADAARVLLVEISPTLRAAQAQAVPGAEHLDRVEDLPRDLPLIVLANEFFDALPPRQFQRQGEGWAERLVGLEGAQLSFTTGTARPHAGLDQRFPLAGDGTIVEVHPRAEEIATELGRRDTRALIFDYGAWDGVGDTLQAVAGHGYADVLQNPGAQDLTTHVGFRWLAEAAAPLRPAFAEQGAFLHRLGIGARAEALARAASPEGAERIADALERLTGPDQMGSLFKALALVPQDAPPPPGFDHDA